MSPMPGDEPPSFSELLAEIIFFFTFTIGA